MWSVFGKAFWNVWFPDVTEVVVETVDGHNRRGCHSPACNKVCRLTVPNAGSAVRPLAMVSSGQCCRWWWASIPKRPISSEQIRPEQIGNSAYTPSISSWSILNGHLFPAVCGNLLYFYRMSRVRLQIKNQYCLMHTCLGVRVQTVSQTAPFISDRTWKCFKIPPIVKVEFIENDDPFLYVIQSWFLSASLPALCYAHQ